MQAIILAAGFGSRLLSLTQHTPKALVKVGGKPMLARSIEYLAVNGFTHIVINVHHLSDQVISFLSGYSLPGVTINISDESSEIKDTGGALVHALPYFNEAEPVLIYNTDVITDLDLNAFLNHHRDYGLDATLLVQQRDSNRKLCFDRQMRLTGWINHSNGEVIGHSAENQFGFELAFSGIHIIEPGLIKQFQHLYASNPFPMIPAYLRMMDTARIGGFIPPDGTMWMEIGSPERLVAVRKMFGGEG